MRLFLHHLFVLSFLVVAVYGAAKQCTPTPIEPIGPAFKPGALVKDRVCDVSKETLNSLALVDPQGCFDKSKLCFLRHTAKQPSRLYFKGKVISDIGCKPIEGAIIDVWQADSLGRYGNIHAGEADEYCRAEMQAKKKGEFHFETDIPGAYGMATGMLGNLDFPPYVPQHMHVLITAPGHDILVAQLYFDQDPARGHDVRERVHKGVKLNSTNPGLVLHLKPCTQRGINMSCTEFTFVMAKSGPNAQKYFNREEEIKAFGCKKFDLLGPLALCFPRILPFIRWYTLLFLGCTVLYLSGLGVFMILRLVINFIRRMKVKRA